MAQVALENCLLALPKKNIRLSNVPVFVVKSALKSLNLSKIIFASDFGEVVLTSFGYVLDFAKLNNAELHLLYLLTPLNFIDTEKMTIFKDRAGELLATSEIYNCFDIEEGVKNIVIKSRLMRLR